MTELGRRYQMAVISEYLTSRKCPTCGDWLRATRTTSVRFYRCASAAPRSAEQNKDYCAAFSMMQIGLRLALTGERPAAWRRAPARANKGADAARSGTATRDARAAAAPPPPPVWSARTRTAARHSHRRRRRPSRPTRRRAPTRPRAAATAMDVDQ